MRTLEKGRRQYMKHPIYLDYNATTPHDPEVIEAMRPFFDEEFGNPSSTHFYGIAPQRAVENARKQLASILNCNPSEVIFTSCGTESNNHAIKGVCRSLKGTGNHIITSSIEHPSVGEVCAYLEQNGFEITYVPVDRSGIVDASDVKKAIRPTTVLITIMHANNEVGSIQPIYEIACLAKQSGILMHTDAAQSLGKIPVDVRALDVDLLSVAGHKLYAPKGIGALYLRDGINIPRFLHGAGQEKGRRAGTENLLEIVGLGKACEIASRDLEENMKHMRNMRDLLYDGICPHINDVRMNGDFKKMLPNTLSLSFKGLEANRILEEIGADVAASAGAACHSDRVEISHVLKAMGIPIEWAKGTIRLSTGRMTTEEQIRRAVDVIVDAVKHLRH
jgi:cysteine desulfurase